MSWNLTAAAHALTGGTTTLPAVGTLAMRFKPTWGVDALHHEFFRQQNAVDTFFGITKWTDGNFYAGWEVASADDRAASVGVGTLTANAWNTLVITWDDVTTNDTILYINAAQIAIHTADLGTTTLTGTRTFANVSPPSADPDMKLAGMGLWNAVLTPAEITTYHGGATPGLIRPASLVNDWWLVDDLLDRKGTDHLAAAGGAAVSTDNPPVYYGSGVRGRSRNRSRAA